MERKSLKIDPSPGGILTPHLIPGDCGPPHPTCQTASRSVQPFWQGTSSLHHRPTDRQADRQILETSVAIRRIYVMHTMRRKNSLRTNCESLSLSLSVYLTLICKQFISRTLMSPTQWTRPTEILHSWLLTDEIQSTVVLHFNDCGMCC